MAVDTVAAVPVPGDGTLLASAGDDHTVRLWDPMTGAQVRELSGHTNCVRALAAVPMPDGSALLASVSDDTAVIIWELFPAVRSM